MLYLANAFSINMLDWSDGNPKKVLFDPMTEEEVKEILQEYKFESYVGHEDTARILSNLLEVEIPFNRGNLTITPDDWLIVAQYIGPRLEAGATTLPEGAEIKFYMVRVQRSLD